MDFLINQLVLENFISIKKLFFGGDFYDFCKEVGLDKSRHHNAYSSMLKDKAHDFY